MKRVIAALVALVLLTGCTGQPLPTTTPTTTEPLPTVSLYNPNSDVEEDTSGAVRAYPMTGHRIQGFRFMGQDMLLFTNDEHVELTTLHLLRGDALNVVQSHTLDITLHPEDAHLRVGEDSIMYYNLAENALVVLDAALKETRRLHLPDEVTQLPVFNSTMDTLYYCVGNEIRALDLSTGISRLLKQHTCQSQSVVGLHFSDTVLEVYVTDEAGNSTVIFVATENGQTLGEDAGVLSLYSVGNAFLLQRMDGVVKENLVGKLEGDLRAIDLQGQTVISQALSMNAVLAGSADALALYDLASGKITSRVKLGSDVQITAAAADPGGNFVWIQGYDKGIGADVLYRWDITATETAENTVYVHKRYTANDPDQLAIELQQKQADALGEKYGLKIHVGTSLPQAADHEFVYEHQPEAFEEALAQLDTILAVYPEGFFAGLAKVSKSGTVHLGLIRDLVDNTGKPVGDGWGMHYVLNGDHYVAVRVGGEFENAVHHELCHMLDAYVYSESKAYDLWDQLNPKEFTYLGSYENYEPAADDPNLQGDTRAFVDGFSMTFMKEDRARLFEYAITPGNEELFKPKYMQTKLIQLCFGIRDAYGLKKDTEIVLPWEQYILEPVKWSKMK